MLEIMLALLSMIVINVKKKFETTGVKNPPKIHFAPISAKIGVSVRIDPKGVMPLFGFGNIFFVRPIRGQKSLPKFRLRASGLRFL